MIIWQNLKHSYSNNLRLFYLGKHTDGNLTHIITHILLSIVGIVFFKLHDFKSYFINKYRSI